MVVMMMMSSRMLVMFILGLVLGISFMTILNSLTTTTTGINNNVYYEDLSFLPTNIQQQQQQQQQQKQRREISSNNMTIGQQIVERTYNWAYRDLQINYCPDRGQDYFLSIQTSFPTKFEQFRKCLEQTYNKIMENSTLAYQYPWWVLTLIRDTANKKSGALGGYHHRTLSPDIAMCSYEKGATKQWKAVMKDQQTKNKTYIPNRDNMKKLKKHPDQIIFIRDPLDRFLSGFLDKCVTDHYTGEPHCEPSEIFQVEYSQAEDKAKEMGHGNEWWKYVKENIKSVNNTNLVSDFRKRVPSETKKLLFDSYVDAFPLKWNVHFMPLSLRCGGLYNTLQYYNFVGSMGVNYYDELHRLTQQYPSIKESVDMVFKLDDHPQIISNNNNNNNNNNQEEEVTTTKKNNVGTETKAASKVLQYYTPHTVRKVLEYMSMDYKMLNLPIPRWAEDMLLQEQEQQQQQQQESQNQI